MRSARASFSSPPLFVCVFSCLCPPSPSCTLPVQTPDPTTLLLDEHEFDPALRAVHHRFLKTRDGPRAGMQVCTRACTCVHKSYFCLCAAEVPPATVSEYIGRGLDTAALPPQSPLFQTVHLYEQHSFNSTLLRPKSTSPYTERLGTGILGSTSPSLKRPITGSVSGKKSPSSSRSPSTTNSRDGGFMAHTQSSNPQMHTSPSQARAQTAAPATAATSSSARPLTATQHEGGTDYLDEDPVTFFAKNKDGPVKFVYLNRVKEPGAHIYNPYKLQMVPYGEIDKDYYTMSSNGITYVRADGHSGICPKIRQSAQARFISFTSCFIFLSWRSSAVLAIAFLLFICIPQNSPRCLSGCAKQTYLKLFVD